ncbi:MAG: glycosyltransferase family 2 protein [Chloroflexota bacterium]
MTIVLEQKQIPTIPHLYSQKIVVVIPAYNEERFIGSVVLQAKQYAETVIVVDDGSADQTAAVAEKAGAHVIVHEANQGKGGALNTGFEMARQYGADAVVTIDADGQHDAEEIEAVVNPVLKNQADIVIGSRYLEATSDVPTHRIIGHIAFNFLTNQASGTEVTDSQSGFRAFSANSIQKIRFSSSGFSVESEMQFLAKEHELSVAEVPITIFYHDPPKRSVIAHGLSVLNGILGLVGQYRPLLFFGIPGFCLLLAGLVWGAWVADVFYRTEQLPTGNALISVMLFIVGNIILSTGFILHSIRGLLINLNHRQA